MFSLKSFYYSDFYLIRSTQCPHSLQTKQVVQSYTQLH